VTAPAPLRVRQVPLARLHPAPWNSNVVPPSILAKVRRSIADFGIVENLVARPLPNPCPVCGGTDHLEVVSGNHRLELYVEFEMRSAPVHTADLDDAHARLLAQTLNRTHGADDPALYKQVLEEMLAKLAVADVTAYLPETEASIERILGDARRKNADNFDTMPPPRKPKSKAGQVYELGPHHRLMCGDSSDPAQLRKLMNGMEAALIVTSPPYNQKLDSFKPTGMHKEDSWVKRIKDAYPDSRPEPEYQDEQVAVLEALLAVAADDASLFYNHKHRYREMKVVSPLSWIWRTGWSLRQEIVWDRAGSITQNARMFMPVDERIYWLTKGNKFNFNSGAEVKSWGTVWRIAPVNEIKQSAPFPIEIPRRILLAASKPGDIVLEPYGGSGTTLIAAESLERSCYAMEVDPRYCDVIRRRYADYTDQPEFAP
jgi:DNA modification methylase